MRVILIASLLLTLPVLTVGAVGKTMKKPSKSEYDRAFAYCRKTYGTTLESVELTKRFGQTGYFCITRG
jgi:hypothetical protein